MLVNTDPYGGMTTCSLKLNVLQTYALIRDKLVTNTVRANSDGISDNKFINKATQLIHCNTSMLTYSKRSLYQTDLVTSMFDPWNNSGILLHRTRFNVP